MDDVEEPIRTNGLVPFAPNAQQIFAWIIAIGSIVLYFGCLVTALPIWWHPAVIFFGAICHGGVWIFLFLGTILNPADENVRRGKVERRRSSNDLDRSIRSHVIEDEMCFFCEVKVGVKSKHCSVCNKCIGDFDHHCVWLNNCVGGRTYRLFLTLLVFGVSTSMLQLVVCITGMVLHYTDQSYRGNHLAFGMDVADGGYIALAIIAIVLSLIALGLFVHLLGFHIMLARKGLSTYEYVVELRQKEKDREDIESQAPSDNHESNRARCCRCCGRNKVAPDNSNTTAASNIVSGSNSAINANINSGNTNDTTSTGKTTPPHGTIEDVS